MELPEKMSHESDMSRIRLSLLKYIVHQNELTELAAVVVLRYYDRAYWSNLHSVEQLRELRYLDRQKAISDFREIFNERPWRVENVNIQSIRKKKPGLWRVQGEITVTDQLPFQIGGGSVHLVADLESEDLTVRRIAIAGKDVKNDSYVEFDDLSVKDILKGLVTRGHFTVELMVDDPFINKVNAQISGYISHDRIQRLDLKDYLSRRQLE